MEKFTLALRDISLQDGTAPMKSKNMLRCMNVRMNGVEKSTCVGDRLLGSWWQCSIFTLKYLAEHPKRSSSVAVCSMHPICTLKGPSWLVYLCNRSVPSKVHSLVRTQSVPHEMSWRLLSLGMDWWLEDLAFTLLSCPAVMVSSCQSSIYHYLWTQSLSATRSTIWDKALSESLEKSRHHYDNPFIAR